MEGNATLENLVRIGTVQNLDAAKRMARVRFEALGITSGWLVVLQHHSAGVAVAEDNEHTHVITDSFTGGGSASTVPAHNHQGTRLTYWMPKVGESVLVLYLPVFNGDGFILGGL